MLCPLSVVGERLKDANLPRSRRRRDLFFFFFFFSHPRRQSSTDALNEISLPIIQHQSKRQNAEGGGEFYSEWEETAESFDQMGLHENLLRGIYAVSRLDGES